MIEIYPWQQKQWQKLVDARTNNRIPHALLLSGRDWLGLDQFASRLAAVSLCTEGSADIACGLCKSCILYQAGNHPDMLQVEPEEPGKQIKVDAIRDLIRFMQLSSQYGKHKIAVINPAEAMNRSAANSLLKILEEPPAGVIFILVSHRAASLPITVRSRCQRLDFSGSSDPATLGWLVKHAACDVTEAADLLNLSQGRPLYALHLRDTEMIQHQNKVLQDLESLNQASADVSQVAQKWQDYGTPVVFQWLLSFLGRMARLKSLVDIQDPIVASAINQDLQRVANRLDLYQLVCCYDLALRNYQLATGPYNLNQAGLLEEFIIYWQTSNTGSRRN